MVPVCQDNEFYLLFQGEVGEHGQKGAKGGKGEHVSDLNQRLIFTSDGDDQDLIMLFLP